MPTSPTRANSTPHLLDMYGDSQMVTSIFVRFITAILLGIGAGIIFNLSKSNYFVVVLDGVCIALVLAALYSVRRERFELAAAILAVTLLSLITIVAANDRGIRQISVLAYPAVLLISSLAVRKRTMVLITLYNIACVAWLMLGEYFGIFTPAIAVRSTPGEFIIASIILALTAFMVRLITETLFDNNLRLQKELKERKETEKALHESLLRQSAILDNIPDLAWLKDEKRRFIAVNGPFAQACGVAPEDLAGKTDLDIWPEELAQAYRKDDLEVMQTGKRKNVKERLVDSNGQESWIQTIKTPIFDDSGQVIGTAGIARDITELKTTEDELRQSRNLLQIVLNTIPIRVFWKDRDLNYLGCNQPFAFDAGVRSPEAMIGKDDYQMGWREQAELYRADDRQVIDSGQPKLEYEEPQTTPDGSRIWLRTSKIPLRDADGRICGVLGTYEDITERKRVEEALKENEAIFSSFLEHSPVYVFFKDKQIRSLRLSKNFEQMLGMPHQDLLGKTMDDLFPSDLAKSMIADDMRILHEGKQISVIEELNGRIYETTKFPVLKDGEPFILAGFTVDITERKHAENAVNYAEQRYRTLFEEAPVMYVITVNDNGTPFIADCNNIFLNTLGYSRAEVVQQPLAKFYTPASRSHLMDEGGYQRALAGSFRTEERELLTRDGRVVKTLLRAIPEIDPHGEVYGTRAMFVDITERKRMEELLFEEKERAEVTLHSIGDAVITTDTNALVKYLNPVAEALTGWKLADAMEKPLSEVFRIIEEGSRQVATSPVERCLREGRIVGLANHSILISRDGREYAIDDSAAPIRNREGDIIGVVLVFHDVTEERRLSRQVAHDAMHDSLTGLVNRREFEKRLERALMSTKERNISHILCYLDLDQFKIVNDAAGHTAGDELLKQISGLLGGLFRQRDTLARLGGDEFGLLLEDCKLDHALIICNEILAKVRNFPFIWAGRSFQVGVSIGVVPVTPQKESVAQLLSQADIACYSAKDLGRGRIFVYHAEDIETAQRHGEILQAARMRDAMVNDEFRLFCQPIVRLSGEAPEFTHYEILLRMADGAERLALPSAFIPSAERYGLMPAIDRWVIRETCITMARHNVHGAQITINLSGNSLDDETLLDYVLHQLREFSIPPEQICFEITETAAIHHLSKAQRFIQGFRERGGKIALDDFGSGFSSFRYLKTLPVDYIKIDGGFVSDMLSNPGDQVMVEAITQVAHALGIKIIAEHASSRDIIERLRQIGVEYAQGFGIGVPLPVELILGSGTRDEN